MQPGLDAYLGVPTLPLGTEFQLPLFWIFPVPWELLEATEGVALSSVLSTRWGTEWTPGGTCLLQNGGGWGWEGERKEENGKVDKKGQRKGR